MASYLISGSSRGIGLALTKALAARPASEVSVVFASGRTESDALKEVIAGSAGRVVFVSLDATSAQAAKAAAENVEGVVGPKGLDVLVNNAGVMPHAAGGVETMNDLDWAFTSNVTSAHIVTSAFLPLLKKGSSKKVINISSTLGSISLADQTKAFPVPAYQITKAALNMLTVQYAKQFESEGFTFIAVSPGWVKTDMGGGNADLTPEESASALVEIAVNSTTAQNGKFLNVRVPGWENKEGLSRSDAAEVPW